MKQIILSAFFVGVSEGKLPGSYAHTFYTEVNTCSVKPASHAYFQNTLKTSAGQLLLICSSDVESNHSEMGAVAKTGKSPWFAAFLDRECCCCCHMIPVGLPVRC